MITSVESIKKVLALWCATLNQFLEILQTPFIEVLYRFLPDLPIFDSIVFILEMIIPPDLSLGLIIFGGFFFLYVVYQFVTWVANLVT